MRKLEKKSMEKSRAMTNYFHSMTILYGLQIELNYNQLVLFGFSIEVLIGNQEIMAIEDTQPKRAEEDVEEDDDDDEPDEWWVQCQFAYEEHI